MRPRRRLPLSVVVLGTVTALVGCSGGGADEQASSTATGAGTPSVVEPTDDPTDEPSEEPTDEPSDPLADRPTDPPAQAIDAGTVAGGAPALVSGTGSATVSFVRDGEFAVVVHLDCGTCAGTRAFMAPTDDRPYPGTLGAANGAYLMDVFEDSDPFQSIWLETEGDWSVRLESWNDLPVASGPQSGTGSTVLLLDGSTTNAEVAWEPAGEGDSFQGRFFGTDQAAARMFGDSEAFTEVVEMPLPGALAITTDGGWSITPTG